MRKLLLSFTTCTTFLFANCPPEHICPVIQPECPPAYCPSQPVENECLFSTRQQVFSDIEFLYWLANEGSLDYSISMTKPSTNPGQKVDAQGDYQLAEYDWEPGFRVSFGFYRATRYWEVIGVYTRLISSNSNHANKPEGEGVFLSSTFPTTVNAPLLSADSHIKLRYHLTDLIATRVFDPNPHLRIHMFASIATAWISQNWKVNYFDSRESETTILNKWRFRGGGMRVGLYGDWYWTGHIYLTGRSSLAAVVGSYHNNSKITLTGDDVIANTSYEDHRLVTHGQLSIGPSWQQPGKCMDIQLFLGYEFNGWFNLQEIYRSLPANDSQPHPTIMNPGTLALHGLTLRLTLGF